MKKEKEKGEKTNAIEHAISTWRKYFHITKHIKTWGDKTNNNLFPSILAARKMFLYIANRRKALLVWLGDWTFGEGITAWVNIFLS